jgi:RimJ/RimL family protein N-acetyltransferase
VSNIRELIVTDIPFFNTVRNECRHVLHNPQAFTLQESYEWFENNTNTFYIYQIDNKPVGYFRTSNWRDNSCYIGLDIHKDYRGKKLAVPAYEEFMKLLNEKHDIKKFKLEVLEHNLIAYSLYKKLGFYLKSSYITDNGNSIIMQLDYELRK